MTSALYVDVDRGPYADLLGEDACWGAERDATKFVGTGPLVAHPPCGHWSRMKALATAPNMHCGPIAVRQLRRHGGVLEHPAGSSLWGFCKLPRPSAPPYLFRPSEFSIEVDQCRWGHPCRKRTWLFFVGVDPNSLPPIPPWREPTHCIDDGAARMAGRPPRLPSIRQDETHLTPPTFAQWLIDAALGASGRQTQPAAR